jgi:Flp pilus assembly protein TadG
MKPQKSPPPRDRGAVGLDWFLMAPVFVALILAMIALPQWPERQGAARGAASEAARAAVLVESPGEVGPTAERVAMQVLANYGVDTGDARVSVSGELVRGAEIQVSVTISMPVIVVPVAGELATSDYTATVTERVEDYREIDP